MPENDLRSAVTQPSGWPENVPLRTWNARLMLKSISGNARKTNAAPIPRAQAQSQSLAGHVLPAAGMVGSPETRTATSLTMPHDSALQIRCQIDDQLPKADVAQSGPPHRAQLQPTTNTGVAPRSVSS